MIVYLQNIGIEGPETLGAFFEQQGYAARTVRLDQGDPLPEDLSAVDAVVCLGGPMNVDEEDRYPFLRAEKVFIRRAVDQGTPFLGICLGAQLLARACGAAVMAAPQAEIGWRTVTLTPEGETDPLFAGLPHAAGVFQWHGDTFDIPAEGTWLVSGPECPYQAFRVGRRAYGLQFHVEITDRSLRQWIPAYVSDPSDRHRMTTDFLAEYAQNKKVFEATAGTIYHNFLRIMNADMAQGAGC